MIDVEEAISRLLDEIKPQTETVELMILDACDSILAEDIYSPISVPCFPKSAMDGYAIMSIDSLGAGRDTPAELMVIGEILAGDAKSYEGKRKTAVRIMTGGPIPNGYDCVIKQEDTNYGEERLLIYKELTAWENYCPVGEDITQGQLVIAKNTRLESRHIGILASMGFAKVRVLRPFKVGIISTGTELREPGMPLRDGQIYSSSSYSIASYLKASGVQVEFLKISIDEIPVFCDMVESSIEKVDLLLTTGAVSVGKKDIILEALTEMGARVLFHKVNMKPGTPVLSSVYKGKIILSLSGNPFAALVNFNVFFWPVLAKSLRNESFCWKEKQAVVKEGYLKPSGLYRFVRAYEEDGEVSIYTNNHRSSVLSNTVESNCMIKQHPGVELEPGTKVTILYWSR